MKSIIIKTSKFVREIKTLTIIILCLIRVRRENLIVILHEETNNVSSLTKRAKRFGLKVVDISEDTININNKSYVDSIVKIIKSNSARLIIVKARLCIDDLKIYPKEYIKVLNIPERSENINVLKYNDNGKTIQADVMQRQEIFSRNEMFDIILSEEYSTNALLCDFIQKLNRYIKLEKMNKIFSSRNIAGVSCFIIWGHGLLIWDDLAKIINKNFNIIIAKQKKITNTKRLIEKIYMKEMLSIDKHIYNKNYHLKKYPSRAMMLLVKEIQSNKSFSCNGHGPEKRKCLSINEHVKQVIRDEFNPKQLSGERSEEHVIHGTDKVFEINVILEEFGLSLLAN